jgi:hypothetical protein
MGEIAEHLAWTFSLSLVPAHSFIAIKSSAAQLWTLKIRRYGEEYRDHNRMSYKNPILLGRSITRGKTIMISLYSERL